MKTSMNERAKAYQEKIENANPQAEAYDFESAYIAGARDERAILIEKAKDAMCRMVCRKKSNNAPKCECCHTMTTFTEMLINEE